MDFDPITRALELMDSGDYRIIGDAVEATLKDFEVTDPDGYIEWLKGIANNVLREQVTSRRKLRIRTQKAGLLRNGVLAQARGEALTLDEEAEIQRLTSGWLRYPVSMGGVDKPLGDCTGRDLDRAAVQQDKWGDRARSAVRTHELEAQFLRELRKHVPDDAPVSSVYSEVAIARLATMLKFSI